MLYLFLKSRYKAAAAESTMRC